MKIVFMGSPEFAVASLKTLVENGYEIVGVITATDKMGGRGNKKVIETAVKKYAVKHGIKVLQPKNLKAPEFVEELRSLKADLQVVVAFRMLPEIVWHMPSIGTFNLHGSLLPKYRGAACIQWPLIDGEKETGVTIMKMDEGLDTGNMLAKRSCFIDSAETTSSLHDKF